MHRMSPMRRTSTRPDATPPFSHQTARLTAGRHSNPDKGVCVMELASMLAGAPFSDRPRTVSPVLAATMRGYNDGLDDRRRQTLKRYAAECLETDRGRAVEKQRRRLLREAVADVRRRHGLRAVFARRATSLGPYVVAHAVGQEVAARDDDAMHARMLAVLDALVACGAAEDAGAARTMDGPLSAPLSITPPERTLGP
jgi:hypothetical protein